MRVFLKIKLTYTGKFVGEEETEELEDESLEDESLVDESELSLSSSLSLEEMHS